MPSRFDEELRAWTETACAAWDYPRPEAAWFDRVRERLPTGLRDAISLGLTEGSLRTVDGYKFRLAGLSESKGPYAWLGKSSKQEPAPHWEYFVQAAEYVRLCALAAPRGLEVLFEDDLMDVSVYRHDDLLLCCEVKERARELDGLLARILDYAIGVDLHEPDRGNDPLRKAKYLVRHRPPYFALVAIGKRLEFSVEYLSDRSFALREDLVPLG
jgi:hypothetical protein